MPVSVLKRILRNLALKRKANAKAADQLAWDVEDLIFISAVGEEKDSTREISFAHFRKEPDNRHVLKVLAWDGGDTPLKMDYLDERLHECLRFPDDANDVEAWRKSWTAAFRTGLRQNIRRSEELAQALAALAMRINKEALSLIKKESANGPLKTLHAGFKDALIHDLTEEAFTDCYAQTITYGLLTAAITKVNQAGVKDLTSTSVLEMVPSTNPFLKDILSSFLEAGGRGEKGIDFDDLGVQDVIDLLRAESTDLPNILRDFGNLTQDEDPVIHFYETFLKIYNKDERVKRGAFYTPRPVVSYIVRSVDELLRKDFGLEDGLADTTTWGEMIKRNPAIKLPPLTDNPGEKKTIKETEPFVQILDPATGTATFLVEVINVIEKTVKAKAWAKLKNGPYDHDQHSKRDEVLKAWNEYVPDHLLKRLHAYELMMAPYVIAHMKVGLKLAETGYRFATEERARIYLTNALEPAKDFKERLNFDIPALAVEAKQVNEVKRTKRFTVIIGNPPYSGHSSNDGEWASGLTERYYKVNGLSLNEANTKWLKDDYVKFMGLSQALLDLTGEGVMSFITNHGFIDNPTFRGMRLSLLGSFDLAQVLHLNGSAKKAQDSQIDQNVFEIQQGVAIALFGRNSGNHSRSVGFFDLVGSREMKYSVLGKSSANNTEWKAIKPAAPFYFFVPEDADLRSEFQAFIKLTDAMPQFSLGCLTKRDELVISHSRQEGARKIMAFINPQKSDIAATQEWGLKLKDNDMWDATIARKAVKEEEVDKYMSKIEYRVWDTRFMFAHKDYVARLNRRIMSHMERPNIALITVRQLASLPHNHFWVVNRPSEQCVISTRTKEGGVVFPLYLYPDKNELKFEKLDQEVSSANFSSSFIFQLKDGMKEAGLAEPAELSAEEIFRYIYAIFYSPGYRSRYAEFLKVDFPRIPLPSKLELFRKLASLGEQLISHHLLLSEYPETGIRDFYRCAAPVDVEKVTWETETLWINAAQTIGFSGISEDVWNFKIGSYQICKKWLDERRKSGEKLSKNDIKQFYKVITSISETIGLMKRIDEAIKLHGGWPKAFQ